MKKQNVNPASLRALINGDYENAIIASTPGGIEQQEAEGQKELIISEKIPWDIRGLIPNINQYDIKDKDIKKLINVLEPIGFKFKSSEKVDDLFLECKLPDGWKKESTEHSMWSNLLDTKGRERASIFYKAAFYDRSSHMFMNRFFDIVSEPQGGYTDDYEGDKKKPWITYVKNANGKVEFETISKNDDYDQIDKNDEKCQEWLEMNYPKHKDVLEYWD